MKANEQKLFALEGIKGLYVTLFMYITQTSHFNKCLCTLKIQ